MGQSRTTFDVQGMSCDNCVRHVRKALTPMAGVSDVVVTLAEGRVEVTHDAAQAPAEQLARALDDAGYPAQLKHSAPA